MGSFPMNVAKYFCDYWFCKYLDSKTVLIYCPHPVQGADGQALPGGHVATGAGVPAEVHPEHGGRQGLPRRRHLRPGALPR